MDTVNIVMIFTITSFGNTSHFSSVRLSGQPLWDPPPLPFSVFLSWYFPVSCAWSSTTLVFLSVASGICSWEHSLCFVHGWIPKPLKYLALGKYFMTVRSKTRECSLCQAYRVLVGPTLSQRTDEWARTFVREAMWWVLQIARSASLVVTVMCV